MVLLAMDGMSSRSTFPSNIHMNTIERHDDDFSYRPRYYFVWGIPVTATIDVLMLPKGNRYTEFFSKPKNPALLNVMKMCDINKLGYPEN